MSERIWTWLRNRIAPDLRVCPECRAAIRHGDQVRHAKYHDRLLNVERSLGGNDDE